MKRITLFDLCFESKLIELTHYIVFYFIILILLSIHNSKESIFALLIRYLPVVFHEPIIFCIRLRYNKNLSRIIFGSSEWECIAPG